jgi:hypothetical protein
MVAASVDGGSGPSGEIVVDGKMTAQPSQAPSCPGHLGKQPAPHPVLHLSIFTPTLVGKFLIRARGDDLCLPDARQYPNDMSTLLSPNRRPPCCKVSTPLGWSQHEKNAAPTRRPGRLGQPQSIWVRALIRPGLGRSKHEEGRTNWALVFQVSIHGINHDALRGILPDPSSSSNFIIDLIPCLSAIGVARYGTRPNCSLRCNGIQDVYR